MTDEAPSLRPYIILAVMPLMFSSNLIIARGAIDSVEPGTLAFWRWGIACLVMLPIAGAGIARHRDVIAREWKHIFALAFLGMGICGAGVYAALKHTTATNGTLIYTTSPAFILLLEILLGRTRAHLRQIIGIAIAFAGAATIIIKGDVRHLAEFRFGGGDLGMAGAALSWAVYSVMLRRESLRELPTAVTFTVIAGAGAILLTPYMAYEAIALGNFPTGLSAWASILGVALISSVGAFSAYQYGVKNVGATLTGIFLYLLPVYGVTLAIIFLGEVLQPYHIAGCALVMAGIILATWPRKWSRNRASAAEE